MIVNLPAAEALDASAVKLYFRAWHGVVSILHDFDQSYEGDVTDWIESPDDRNEERADYLQGSQDDLHAISSIIQQGFVA